MSRSGISFFILFITQIFLSACGAYSSAPAPTANPDAQPITVNIQGRITDKTGVADVLVNLGTYQTVSDTNGYYLLSGVDIGKRSQLVVSFSKDHYALNQKVLPINEGLDSYSVDVRLSPYDYIGTIDSSSTQPQQLIISDPAGSSLPPLMEVGFPVGSIPASGPITVSVKRGDPTSAEGKAIFPGPYLGIAQGQQNLSPEFIESVVFTEITLKDLQGQEISQLNKAVSVSLQLPSSLQSSYSVGDSIPWWSYDEAQGIWVREDAEPATPELDDAVIISKSGLLYAEAKAGHFSWWNVDKPVTEHACLCAEVVDQDDEPLKNIGIVANGITYNAGSSIQYTQADGRVCMTVKRSEPGSTPAKVELHAEYGTLQYRYKVTDPAEGILNTATVYTPTAEGSTIQTSGGECQPLNNPFKLYLDGEIFGMVTDELGNPIPNFEFSSNLGKTIKTDSEGRYSTSAPGGANVILFKPRVFSSTVDVSYTEPTELNIVIANQPPWIQLFNARKHNSGDADNQWLLTVLASDPEGGDVTYHWQSDVGSISVIGNPGSSAMFNAPNTDSGTATITLTVTDPKGASTTVTKKISWGMGLEEKTNLKIYFRDNKVNEQAISGLIVTLHDTNGAITQRYVSNSEGVIDAGDVGKEKVTMTVLVQNRPTVFDLHPYSLSNYMHTFTDVEVGDLVFYLDHYNSVLSPSPSRILAAQASAFISLNLDQVDTAARYVWRANAKSDNRMGASGRGQDTQNIFALDTDLHLDQQLDLLSYATSGNNDDVLGYDFLLDKDMAANGSYNYELSLTRQADSVNWSRGLATLNNQGSYNLRLYAERKGKLYSYTPFQRPSSLYEPLPDSGRFTMLPEFPADRYVAEIYGYEPESDYTFVGGYRYYPYPPTAIEMIEPEQRISAGSFSDSRFGWLNTGSADLTILKLTPPGCPLSQFNWYVWLDGDSNNWSLIEPPAEVASCISSASIRNAIGGYRNVASYIDRFYIQRQEIDVVNGYSALWSMLAGGVDLETMALQRSYVRHSLYTHMDAP